LDTPKRGKRDNQKDQSKNDVFDDKPMATPPLAYAKATASGIVNGKVKGLKQRGVRG
jgi:hypothetical protein